MSFSYRIAKSTVSTIIRDTCNAIWEALQGTYLKAPKSQAEWKEIAKQFMDVWNFPHTVGAIDGKHVAIKCPLNSGSQYYNYKGFFSLALLAICDAHYCFTLVDSTLATMVPTMIAASLVILKWESYFRMERCIYHSLIV